MQETHWYLWHYNPQLFFFKSYFWYLFSKLSNYCLLKDECWYQNWHQNWQCFVFSHGHPRSKHYRLWYQHLTWIRHKSGVSWPEYGICNLIINFHLITISVAGLPKNFDSSFYGARAVTSAAGQGAIVQIGKHFYEVTCEISGCSWSILAQNLDVGVIDAVMMTLPLEYTSKCDSCKAGFFGDFCEGK